MKTQDNYFQTFEDYKKYVNETEQIELLGETPPTHGIMIFATLDAKSQNKIVRFNKMKKHVVEVKDDNICEISFSLPRYGELFYGFKVLGDIQNVELSYNDGKFEYGVIDRNHFTCDPPLPIPMFYECRIKVSFKPYFDIDHTHSDCEIYDNVFMYEQGMIMNPHQRTSFYELIGENYTRADEYFLRLAGGKA